MRLCQDILVKFIFYLMSHISICMHEFSNHHVTCLSWLNEENLYMRFHTKYCMFTAPVHAGRCYCKLKKQNKTDLIYQHNSNASFSICLRVCVHLSPSLSLCMHECLCVCHSHLFHTHALNKFFFRSFEDHLSRSCTIFKTNAYLTPTVQQF